MTDLPGLVLTLNSTTDFSIMDQLGVRYTAGQARALYERGLVHDYNIAFGRLIEHGWDLALTRDFFARKRAEYYHAAEISSARAGRR